MRVGIGVMVVAIVMAALPVFACEEPKCPDVEVTCQCDCDEVVLPGFWQVMIQKEMRCGTITVVGDGFMLNEGKGKPEFFLINKLKRANQVESCDTSPPASP